MKRLFLNRAGLTVLEMIIAGVIFAIFIVQFGAIWSSSELQIAYVLNRARVAREAAVARTLLLKDLSTADGMALAESPANGFDIYLHNGSTITYTYDYNATDKTGFLLRHNTADSSDMTAAKLVKSLTPTINVGNTDITMVFARGSAEVTFNLRRDTALNTTP